MHFIFSHQGDASPITPEHHATASAANHPNVRRSEDAVTLLDGKPYIPSTHTDVQRTWRKYGWTPPSEYRVTEEF